uniref:Putative PKHD-type hydroxylase At1g22950 n=1 Tax=Anthurium amnicola TaxID=1678845 RepID=A0A1D1YS44_9ARAE
MSSDAPAKKREEPPQPQRQQQHHQQQAGNDSGNGNGVAAPLAGAGGRPSAYGDRRLRLNPNKDHKPERYDDVQTEFDPCIFSSLERHLPPSMLEVPRDAKVQFMKEILSRYLPDGERTRVRHRPDLSHLPALPLLPHARLGACGLLGSFFLFSA